MSSRQESVLQHTHRSSAHYPEREGGREIGREEEREGGSRKERESVFREIAGTLKKQPSEIITITLVGAFEYCVSMLLILVILVCPHMLQHIVFFLVLLIVWLQ